jgi:uncharacterized membrane protein
MNPAHIHLLWNHFPILGALFAAGVLLAGVALNDRKINQVGLVSLVIFTLLTLPAFLSGEGAEEILEEYPGISHAAIHDHEEMAELGLWVMVFAGLVALVGFILQRRKEHVHRLMSIIALVAALAAFGVMARVGLSGGEIRHPEIVKPLAAPEVGSDTETHHD